MFTVYLIRNENNKTYIGQTGDLENRVKRHNGLLRTKAKSYTNINKGNWKIVFKEEYDTRQEAIEREKYLKSHHGRDWLKAKLSGR